MSAPFKFENHLFISYAHIDNYHFSGSAKGWVELLHERLEIRLAQLLGKKPTIWRDPERTSNITYIGETMSNRKNSGKAGSRLCLPDGILSRPKN